jgi:hypothetical protein
MTALAQQAATSISAGTSQLPFTLLLRDIRRRQRRARPLV